jgi:hypothetical protein
MSEIAPAATKAPELPLPRSVPALLSFVAGYIDIYTFLALFGLFVAQVTGSFVTAGAELVSHDVGITGKVIAIVAFLVAAALTAGLIALARDRDRPVLPWMLGFETCSSPPSPSHSSSPPRRRTPTTGVPSSPERSAPWPWARRALSSGCSCAVFRRPTS